MSYRFPLRRRWAILVIGLVVAFPALSASPEWAGETIEEILEYPESDRIMKAESSRRDDLQVESELVLQRIRVKESILDEIELGRLVLRDAANRFRAMDLDRPEIAQLLYTPERLGSADEIAAQCVIRHLRTRYESGRPLTAGAMGRMIAEFESAFGYDPMKDEPE